MALSAHHQAIAHLTDALALLPARNGVQARDERELQLLTDLGISGADIIWDGSGANNTFDQPGASSFPPILPKSSWPTFLHRAYDNILNFAVEQLM